MEPDYEDCKTSPEAAPLLLPPEFGSEKDPCTHPCSGEQQRRQQLRPPLGLRRSKVGGGEPREQFVVRLPLKLEWRILFAVFHDSQLKTIPCLI